MCRLNKNEWFFIVRKNTNERLLNKSNDINVCQEYHLEPILTHLNRHSDVWCAMSIAEYEEMFSEYMGNNRYCIYTEEEESEYYD